MNNPAINTALSEMEQNLKNLESARNQVSQVSEKSKEIITAVSSLVNSVENLKSSYADEERNLKQVFKNVSNDLSISFNGSIEEVKKSTKEYHKFQDEHIKSIQSSVQKLNTSLSETSKKLEEIDIEKNYAIVKNSLDNQSSIIDSNLNNVLAELKGLKVQIEEHISSFGSFEKKLFEYFTENDKKIISLIDLVKNGHSEISDNLNNLNLSFERIINNSLDKHSATIIEKVETLNETYSTKLEQLNEDLRNLTLRVEDIDSNFKASAEKFEKNQKTNLVAISLGLILVILILIFK